MPTPVLAPAIPGQLPRRVSAMTLGGQSEGYKTKTDVQALYSWLKKEFPIPESNDLTQLKSEYKNTLCVLAEDIMDINQLNDLKYNEPEKKDLNRSMSRQASG